MSACPPPPCLPPPRVLALCATSVRQSTWSLLRAVATLAVAATVLGGCGAMRSYRAELDATLSRAASGDVPGAIRQLEKNNSSKDKDLLYGLELGELKRLANDFDGSSFAYQQADREIQEWEAAARLDPTRTLGSVGAYLVNDKVRPYEGYDYEKVMVSTRLAMNKLAAGDWDGARVEIKRTHEREALIQEVRGKQYAKAAEEAQEKHAATSFKEVGGYPIVTLATPESLGLRNSYQNALSHYLAGFVYEALDEPGLAAPGYRIAAELRPDQPMLEQSLGELDQRVYSQGGGDDGLCDALFVIETGAIPGRLSRDFSFPVPVGPSGGWIQMSASFPVLTPPEFNYQKPDVQVDRSLTLPSAHVLDLDAMARRALSDEMPFIMLRMTARLAARAAAQYSIQEQMRNARRDDGGAAGLAFVLLAMQIGGAVLESADERSWRSLPAQVTVARGKLSRGVHSVNIRSDAGSATFDVNLASRHAVVAVRLFRGQSYVTPVGAPGGVTTPTLPGSTSAEAAPDGALGPLRAAPGDVAIAATPVEPEPLYAETRIIAFPSAAPAAFSPR